MDSSGKARPRSTREKIRRFSPSWFAAVMGTGVVTCLLRNFPYGANSKPLHYVSLAFFLLSVTMFVLFTAITVARYIMFPKIWFIMIRHPVQSLFLACYPMALGVLINAAVGLLCIDTQLGGVRFLHAMWALWWIDAALSLAVCFGMIYMMVTRHEQAMEGMTAVWLLPVLPPIVVSTTGQILASALAASSPGKTLITASTSAVMLIIGLTLTLVVMTVYAQRLIVHGLPSVGLIVSVMLPIGPFGQGGYSLLLMGKVFRRILPIEGHSSHILSSPIFGDLVESSCFCLAVMMWAAGMWWGIFSVIGFTEVAYTHKIPFRVTFWGMTFPLGVYALLNFELGKTVDSGFFRIVGMVVSSTVFVLWSFVAWRTVVKTIRGTIFHAPWLDDQPLGLSTVGPVREADAEAPQPQTGVSTMVMELPELNVSAKTINEAGLDKHNRALGSHN